MDTGALTWPLPLCFDPERDRRRERRVRASVADLPKQEPRLLCATCRQVITYPIHRISVHGPHEHCRTNPLGFSFRIGCFRDASGCLLVGEASAEHTWFAGHTWRVALCAGCRTHLGWRFQSPGNHFFGLILDRLILEQPANNASGGG